MTEPEMKIPSLQHFLHQLRSAGRRALIPFVPAGDPDLPFTRQLLDELPRAGADVIEIGLPYSDPIADGPLIQAAYTRALKRGICVEAIFELVRDWLAETQPDTTPSGELPSAHATCQPNSSSKAKLVAMCSYSLVFRQGEEKFVRRCADAGLAGLIVPDLPVEEAASLAEQCRHAGLALVQLVTPTTPPHRARQIVELSSGFVYCVSVTGITGVRDRLPQELEDRLAWLRRVTDLPLCVGFGVSRPEHARWLRHHADGIVVGSALVARLAEAANRPRAEVLASVVDLVRQLRAALDTAQDTTCGTSSAS